MLGAEFVIDVLTVIAKAGKVAENSPSLTLMTMLL